MMFSRPKKAVILAAGFGNRMKPLTDSCPKPLLKVHGKPMIDWIIDALENVGVNEVIVNTHYLADKMKAHLAIYDDRDIDIHISHEDEILDTGGGVLNVLDRLGGEPFYVANGDIFWQDFENHTSALQGLANMWDSSKMKILLMLYPLAKLPKQTELSGDYIINEAGQIYCKSGGEYVFAGPRIVNPAIFEDSPKGAFSFKLLFDKAENKDKLYGYIHDGAWYHVGTPEELEHVNEME